MQRSLVEDPKAPVSRDRNEQAGVQTARVVATHPQRGFLCITVPNVPIPNAPCRRSLKQVSCHE